MTAPYVRPVSLAETNTRNIVQNLYHLTNYVNTNVSVGGSVVTIQDFGGAGDGITDNTNALNAALAEVQSLGGGTILFGPGKFNISSTININTGYITLMGCAAGGLHNVGNDPVPPPTILQWIGSAGSTMVSFTSLTGSTRAQEGGGITGIWFYSDNMGGGGNSANTALSVNSWRSGKFERLFFHEFADKALKLGVVASIAEGESCQNNRFLNLESQNFGRRNGGFCSMTGSSIANPSFNIFDDITCNFTDSIPFDFINADNNRIYNFRAFTGSSATATAGIALRAGTNAGGFASSNTIDHYSCSLPVLCEGSTDNTIASDSNSILNIDRLNGTPAPTIHTGATVYYSFLRGDTYRLPLVQAGFGENNSNAIAASTSLVGSVSSVWIKNSSQSHLVLDDGSNVWATRITSGGMLQFVETAGSGNGIVQGQVLQATTWLQSGVTTISGLPSASSFQGARYMVTNSSLPSSGNFGVAVTSSTANNTVPVFSDGTTWRIG